jgi:DNA-binding HxlR family transcriptional regulator
VAKALPTHAKPEKSKVRISASDSDRLRRSGRREGRTDASQSSVPLLELPELDRLIHERIRLGIVSALATNDSLSFNDLKRVLKTTDGNLSVHARKLEEAQYISCVKFFEGRMPRTEYRLTATGRRALAEYLDQMEQWIRVTREEK